MKPAPQPLPPDVIPGMPWGPFRYRRYPVFSPAWLLRRTVFAAVVIVLYAALAASGQLAGNATWPDTLATAGCFVAGGLLMVTTGPALATWVRRRGWSRRAEAWGVIATVVLGFLSAAMADHWASTQMTQSMKVREIPASQRNINELDEAKIRIFDLLAGFLYFAVGGGLAALAYFSERRRVAARDAHLSQLDTGMRLAVLQAQIEPHFLFNTLASIRPLIRHDAERAEAALDALAAHLRATIPQMRSGVKSTLGQQLDICASYLTVMQVRMGARLRHELNVPAELRAREFPALMLLSLVENAIKHGIEPKPGPGQIIVSAAVTGGELRVSVADDGQGLRDGLSGGLGLANIREQLHGRHGNAGRLTIAARPEGGAIAAITIPLNA